MITDLERRESRIAKRLWQLGHGDVFAGVTNDALERKERIRTAILKARVESAVLGPKVDGKPITFTQAFETTYAEPLLCSKMRNKEICK